MQFSESEQKKLITAYRNAFANQLDECPVNRTNLRPYRNLLYILQKDQPIQGQQSLADLKTQLKNSDPDQRLAALKLLSSLSLKDKLTFLQNNQNDLIQIVNGQQYHFQAVLAISDYLLRAYMLIRYSPELYALSINRISSLYCKIVELVFGANKEYCWNALEVMRTLSVLGEEKEDRLLGKLGAFIDGRLEDAVNRVVGFEVRSRARLFLGLVTLLPRCPNGNMVLDRLEKELLRIINSMNQYQPLIESLHCLLLLLKTCPHPWPTSNKILKNCYQVQQLNLLRRQYLPIIVDTVLQAEHSNNRLKYQISVRALEQSRSFQQQYTRLVLMESAVKNLFQISKEYTKKRDSVMVSLFLQKWFVSRIKDESDIFKEELLMAVISQYFQEGTNQVLDVLDICHRLLDWECNTKYQQNVDSVKFTFQLYLKFIREVYPKLGKAMAPYLTEIFNRINEQNIAFLFKMKIIIVLAEILPAEELRKDLRVNFIQGELRPFMMPRNPKPIFSMMYANTLEGASESAKQIEYIKNIMTLLVVLPTKLQELAPNIDSLIAEYHSYLSKLQGMQDSNKQLINTLYQNQDQPLINQVSRNFLLSLYHKTSQLAIYSYSLPTVCPLTNNLQHSVLPCNSPIDLTITSHRFLNGRLILTLKALSHLPATGAKILVSTPKQCIELELESTVLELEVSPPGLVHFEVVTESGSSLGKGVYKVRVDCGWRRLDWFEVGGLGMKGSWEGREGWTARYLGLYWGEPVCIGFKEGSSDVTVYTCSKSIIQSLLEDLQEILDTITDGALTIKY